MPIKTTRTWFILTTIIFTIVNLVFYDIPGREIQQLDHGLQPAGFHSIRFDAKGLSSGVYFYQLKTEQFQKIKRFILTK